MVVVTAAAIATLLGSAALTVDVGSFYVAKRKQQAATDIAAMVAADHLGSATQAAETALADNGVNASAQLSLEFGAYTADVSVAPDLRFRQVQPASANAVRVGVNTTAPLYFGSALLSLVGGDGQSSGVPIRTRAVATQADFAAFAIGSRLASLNGGILNQLLGGLLGANVSLSVADYNALANTQIDLFQLSQTLATRINASTVTYGQLASSAIRVNDVLAAVRDTASSTGGSAAASSALALLAKAKMGSSDTVTLAQVVGFGPYQTLVIGSEQPVASRISALDLVTGLAEIAGSGHLVNLDLSSAVPGLLSLKATIEIGNRPAQSSFAAVGRPGSSVSTAQTRMLVTAQLRAAPPLLTLMLPMYVDLASSTATLSSLACGPAPGTPSAILQVLPSLVDAWIGGVATTDVGQFGTPSAVSWAPIATVLGLAAINGRAHLAIANTAPSSVMFSATDIAAGTKRTSSTQDFSASLASSLVTHLQLTVGPNAGVAPPTAVTQAINQSLAAAAPSIDPVLDALLSTLGLRVGEADTWITGVKCGGGVLVN